MTHRVVVVDDEPLARRGVRARLRRYPDFVVVRECASGEEAVAAIRRLQPDLVFLDVEMPGMSGLDVVRAVGQALPPTVFTTAYAEYAVEAFGAAAVDYLLKPLDADRFERALSRARWTIEARRRTGATGDAAPAAPPLERFWVKTRGRVVLVAVEDVDWIEAEGDYARLHVGAQSHLLSSSLTRLEARLPSSFLRIHRSALVSLPRVRTLVPRSNLDHEVVLCTGARLRLSRTYYRRFAAALRARGAPS
jgi:two-component system LytT family response regulator